MALMRYRPKLLLVLSVLLVALVALLVWAWSARLIGTPLTFAGARLGWERQALRHYTLEVEARDDNTDLHMLLEVRDERLVSGVNLRTGKHLTADDLAPHAVWLPVGRLFDRIELQRYIDTTWQHQVADLAPWVAQQFHWCYVIPVRVDYDPQLGYPTLVRFRHNVCSRHDPLEVRLGVTPLP